MGGVAAVDGGAEAGVAFEAKLTVSRDESAQDMSPLEEVVRWKEAVGRRGGDEGGGGGSVSEVDGGAVRAVEAG